MDLQDTNPEMFDRTVWLDQLLSPPPQRLSPFEEQNERNVIIGEEVSMRYQVSDGIVLWPDNKRALKNDNPLENNYDILRGHCTISEPPVSLYHYLTPNSLKRRSNETYQAIDESPKKYTRRNGSIVNNGSVQGWASGQVEELAKHLVADFDGSFSALAATDLARTVASYNINEALLTLPSALTVFKQEALSPENHINNSNVNQVAQGSTHNMDANNGNVGLSVELDRNHDGNNDVMNSIAFPTLIPSSINNKHMNNTGIHANHNDSNGRGLSDCNIENYPNASSAGHDVSSSQQGNEFNEDSRFQYVLAAATSIATKIDEETLTYLNQGQSYEIKLKKLGDLSAYRGKILKSKIRICFHERRLQYTEKEQILAWQSARPGERLFEVDIPLSYGMLGIAQSTPSKNNVEFMWDPTKEVGVYIKVNCVSTEFTTKKHGGEKGVPFRIQVETLLPGGPRLHAASCQIKVFKLKGADRKHKQDRDKILRRPSNEQERYQSSYDCTVLSDIPLDSLSPVSTMSENDAHSSAPAETMTPPHSSSSAESSLLNAIPSPVSEWSSDESPTHDSKTSIQYRPPPINRSVQEAAAWLREYFPAYVSLFANYSGHDLLNLTRQELIEFCGPLDGIRMHNQLVRKTPEPKLIIYCALESDDEHKFQIVSLLDKTTETLTAKLSSIFDIPRETLHSVWIEGPKGIRILMCNDLISNMEKGSIYLIEVLKNTTNGCVKLLLKPYKG